MSAETLSPQTTPDEKPRQTVLAVMEELGGLSRCGLAYDRMPLAVGEEPMLKDIQQLDELCGLIAKQDEELDIHTQLAVSRVSTRIIESLSIVPPEMAAAGLSGLLRFRSAVADRQLASGVITPEEYTRYIGFDMVNFLHELTPDEIAAIRELSEQDRGDVDAVLEVMRVYYDDLIDIESNNAAQRVGWQRCKARCEGYGTLREKYDALQRGELECDNLPLLDVLLDEFVLEAYEGGDVRGAGKRALEAVGLSRGLVRDIEAAMYKRLDQSEDWYSLQDAIAWMMRLVDTVQEIGTSDIERLRTECGLVNFADIPMLQLRRMVDFLNGDSVLMEHLRQHEVCVIIKDATNDYNGAFEESCDMFETNDGATLVFEMVGCPSRKVARLVAYRIEHINSLLRAHHVQPAALVIAGHGNSRGIAMGTATIGNKNSSLPLGKSGLPGIMANMKPDRDGNCSIIFDSCSQDAPGLGGEDDTTLTRTAGELLSMRWLFPRGNSAWPTYMIYGMKQPYATVKDYVTGGLYGKSVVGAAEGSGAGDSTAREVMPVPFERVIVTDQGSVYRDLRQHVPGAGKDIVMGEREQLPIDMVLPMFRRD